PPHRPPHDTPMPPEKTPTRPPPPPPPPPAPPAEPAPPPRPAARGGRAAAARPPPPPAAAPAAPPPPPAPAPAARPPPPARRAAPDGHRAASDDRRDLGDARCAFQERVDVPPAADELDRALIAVLVQQPCVEVLEDRAQLLRAAVLHAQLEQRELPLDVILAGHIGDVDDVDELRELLRDLLDHALRAGRHERQARYGLVGGRRYVQALDVVAASREQIRDARQRARFILQQYRNNMSHDA